MTNHSVSKPTATEKSKSPVPAVEKAFDILEVLADASDGLTINEMVVSLDRTMGEIYRTIIYLTDRGYLTQNSDTSRYALTLKLFELSHRHDPTERLINKTLPILERIAAITEQSCHLGVLNRTNILVLASVQSPRPAGYSVRTGSLFPVVSTSSGHVILAFMKAEAQTRYINRLPSEEQQSVQERLDDIRNHGYEDTASTMIEGVRNLCVPIFNSSGVAGAMTSGFVQQTDQIMSASETLQTLRISATELSQSLGFQLKQSEFHVALSP